LLIDGVKKISKRQIVVPQYHYKTPLTAFLPQHLGLYI